MRGRCKTSMLLAVTLPRRSAEVSAVASWCNSAASPERPVRPSAGLAKRLRRRYSSHLVTACVSERSTVGARGARCAPWAFFQPIPGNFYEPTVFFDAFALPSEFAEGWRCHRLAGCFGPCGPGPGLCQRHRGRRFGSRRVWPHQHWQCTTAAAAVCRAHDHPPTHRGHAARPHLSVRAAWARQELGQALWSLQRLQPAGVLCAGATAPWSATTALAPGPR
jgi:hypothetical protein